MVASVDGSTSCKATDLFVVQEGQEPSDDNGLLDEGESIH